MNLLTVADGFGDSVAVPPWYPEYIKWPEIIKLMTKNVNLINLSRYGAGNEYIIECIQQNIDNCDVALVQWAQPNRLDLVLDHQEPYKSIWTDTILADPVYNNNILNIDNKKIWLSSGSTANLVKEYHSKFISITQHQMRSQIYIKYAMLLLKSRGIDYKFMLSVNGSYLSNSVDIEPWLWHYPWCGMDNFRSVSKYAELDLAITQPIPLIHFDFIKTYIMPNVNLTWRCEQEINAVENMLYRKYQESIKNKPNDTN